MFVEAKKQQFHKERKKYAELRKRSIHARLEYDEAKVDKVAPSKLTKLEMSLVKAEQAEEVFCELYAQRIFDTFSVSQPTLVRRRTREVVHWREAFGSDFSVLSQGLKSSLIALIEEDGGQYRFQCNADE